MSASQRRGEREEDVRPLDSGRNLGEELLEHRDGPLRVAGETVKVRRSQASLTRSCRIVRRQLGRELGELGRGGGRPASGGVLGGGVELGGDCRVGALRGERQVASAFLDVRDCIGERAVHRAALPERRALVADRGEQRVREAHVRVVELDHALPNGLLERVEDGLPVAVGGGDEVDRRPRERCDLQQDVERLTGSRARRPPSSSRRLSGTRSGWPGDRPRVRADELAAELEREERVARRRLVHARELGRVSSSPSRSSSRLWTAPRLSG